MKAIHSLMIVSVLLSSCKQKSETPPDIYSPVSNSLSSELRKLYDVSLLPLYDVSETAQTSSYDTTGGNDDGFSGRYSFLRRNADSSLVIFDVQGAGVINRIWTPTPTEDTLDFFLDGKDVPSFSLKFSELFSGERFPFVAPLCGNQIGGFYCYFPILFSNGCKIVFRGEHIQFHQIQYRLYPSGTEVKTFDDDLDEEENNALKKITTLWSSRGVAIGDVLKNEDQHWQENSAEIELTPGKSIPIFNSEQGGRILGIEINPSTVFEGISKDVDIRITWDDESRPAVYCPVADFFGYAFGSSSMQSLLLGSSGNVNYCYFPMPYDKSANIELISRRKDDSALTKLNVKVYFNNRSRDIVREGKFYSHWNKNIKLQTGKPHIFLDVNGKGHYVGTVLQSQGLKAGMTYFFEGDDSTVVDGTMRLHGTGSEDYFNGGWYAMLDRWDGKVSLPLHGSLDYSLPFCRTGGYRLYLSDKISFKENIFHSMEHGPKGNAFPVDYTSLAFYYNDHPAENVVTPTEELSKVFLPDTLMIYPQLMEFTTSGSVDFRSAWKYNTGGESFTYTVADNSWLRISLADIPEGNYSVYFDLIKKTDGCDFSLWQRQTNISPLISTNNSVELREENLYVCDIEVRDYKNTVTIRFKSGEQKNSFLLNRLKLTRKS